MGLESGLEEFVRIVEVGSVAGAARALGVPRASVSRRLASLEAAYGVRLLHRDTRRQALTEAGVELYQRARRIVAELTEARQAVSALDGVPRGVLRVGLPPAAGIEMVLADAYLTAWPEVELEFVSGHGQLDLLGSGIDVALWVGPVPDERLIGRKLASFQSLVYAAPRLIERLGMPTLTTLADYPCVLGFDSVGRPERSWPLWAGGTTPVQGRMRSNSMPGRIDGARMGLGLTMASERFVRDQVAAGELVPVLTDVVGRMTTVRLVWQPSAFLDPKIRAFVDLSVQVVERMVKARDAAAPPSC